MSESMRNAINQQLLTILGRMDVVNQWWNSPNIEFNLQTPNDLFNSGQKGQCAVLAYVLKYTEFEGGL